MAFENVDKQLEPIVEEIASNFAGKNKAREQGLSASRDAIRLSANSIRAVHRGEFDKAAELCAQAGNLLQEARASLAEHPDIFHAGFIHDGQKEYAEAALTLALIAGQKLPDPAALGVERQAYLNGLGEAVGELRRHLLDRLRAGDIARSEACLEAMDEIYGALVTFDYPDAMTGGLRRTTDAARGILERTRGDLTVAAVQKRLEDKIG
ncbi:MAG TPA: haloacid dehalogenase [Dehalococcoidia bacterium]|nr:haloacid dehalogenase [Dehalococcoidia bacterium]